jgi:hypothetical protein
MIAPGRDRGDPRPPVRAARERPLRPDDDARHHVADDEDGGQGAAGQGGALLKIKIVRFPALADTH